MASTLEVLYYGILPDPSGNVKDCPKRQAFDKASQAQPHHVCRVSALGWVGTARTEDQTHCCVQNGGLDLATGR